MTTVVELEGYGDFDTVYVDSIWVIEGDCPEIPKSYTYENSKDFKQAYKDLLRLGFTKVKTKSITVGGNL